MGCLWEVGPKASIPVVRAIWIAVVVLVQDLKEAP